MQACPLVSLLLLSLYPSGSGFALPEQLSFERGRAAAAGGNDMENRHCPLSLQQPPRPNDCTYWVTNYVLAGEHPTDKRGVDATRRKLRSYLSVGITHFVDLTHKGEKTDYVGILQQEAKEQNVKYARFSIPDFGIPTRSECMTDIVDYIDETVESGKKVYVHCRGGIGRTGTTVGCYLVRHGLEGQVALDRVNQLFLFSDRSMESTYSPETREQMDFVRSWNERE